MTEIEWSVCSQVYPMLLALRSKRSPRKWSTRKARLFALACCRRVWHLLDSPADRRAVEVAEEMADKKKKLTDLRVSYDAASTIDLGRDPDDRRGRGLRKRPQMGLQLRPLGQSQGAQGLPRRPLGPHADAPGRSGGNGQRCPSAAILSGRPECGQSGNAGPVQVAP
jgi:hypothetical protein